MRNIKFLFLLFFATSCLIVHSQGIFNPCGTQGSINPFCTEQNDFNVAYTSVTGQSSSTDNGWYQNQNLTTCLSSSPNASWYAFQIAAPGDLLIFIYQYSQCNPDGTPNTSSSGLDIDFACWGPFSQYEVFNQEDFKQRLCNGDFTLTSGIPPYPPYNASHRPSNGNHSNDMGGYPIYPDNYDYYTTPNNIPLIDCSYNSAATEWCFIPNARNGDWYLLMVCNYNGGNGYFGFQSQSTGISANNQATSNCNLLNCMGVSNSSPCQGETITLYCTEKRSELPNNVQYKWIKPDGTILGTTTNPDTSFSITVTDASMNGRYELHLLNTSPERHGHVDVEVKFTPAEPTASATTICAGDSIKLTTPYVADYDPDYTFGDGFLFWYLNQIGGTPVSADTSVTVYPTENCDYILSVKNGNTGCTNTNSVHITVNPIPDITLSAGKTNLCHNESTQITAECHENVSYSWSNGATTATITAQPAETRTYTVTAQLQEGARCSKKDSIVINVDPEITLTSSVKATHCGQKIGGITMHARGGDGHFWFASTPTIVFNDSIASNITDGTYVVTATDGKACTQSATVEVPSLPGPTPCFIFASTDNVNMVINNCTQGNNNRYSWDFGDGVTSFETNPIHEYMEPGRYSVNMIVTDEYDCTDSLRQDYRINGPVYVPNAFSPNGDGVNDEMMIVGRTIQKTEFLWVIYDRHGSLVFMSTDPEISWDGTLFNAGKEAPSGVYVYRIKYKDVNGNYFERDGNITLIR